MLLVVGRTRLLADPDTFWHIVVGRQIISSGNFMRTDPFTFTFSGQPWCAHQWLGECGMAVIEGCAGFDGLVVATCIMLAALYAWAGSRLIRNGLHWLVAVLVISLAMTASSYSYLVRPHVCTMVLLGISFGILCDFEQGKIRLQSIWWLLPLFVLWSNIHGGVLGGIATLTLAVLGWTTMKWMGKPSPIRDLRDAANLFALVAACCAGTLLNPYGLDTPRTWLKIMQSDLPNLIIEHAPLDPASPEGRMVLLFAAGYLIFLLGTLPTFPRVTWLLPVVWLYLTWTRIRHGPLFAIVATIAFADLLLYSRCTALLEKRKFFTRRPAQAEPSLFPFGTVVVVVIAMFGAAVCTKSIGALAGANWSWSRPDPEIWPQELLSDLKQLELPSVSTARIFNEQKFGGFLIYNTPGLRVFIDGRCELFGDKFMNAYVDAQQRPEAIEEWSDRYGFNVALTRTNSSFDQIFTKSVDWHTVRKTAIATLYARTHAAQNKVRPLSPQ